MTRGHVLTVSLSFEKLLLPVETQEHHLIIYHYLQIICKLLVSYQVNWWKTINQSFLTVLYLFIWSFVPWKQWIHEMLMKENRNSCICAWFRSVISPSNHFIQHAWNDWTARMLLRPSLIKVYQKLGRERCQLSITSFVITIIIDVL